MKIANFNRTSSFFVLITLLVLNCSFSANAGERSTEESFANFFNYKKRIKIPIEVVDKYGRVPTSKDIKPVINNYKLELPLNGESGSSSADSTVNFIIPNEGFGINERSGDIYLPMLSVPLSGPKGCSNNKKGIFRLSIDDNMDISSVKTLAPCTYAGMEARTLAFDRDDFLILSHSPSSLLHAVLRLTPDSQAQAILPFAKEIIDNSCAESEQFYIKTFFILPNGNIAFGVWNHMKRLWQLVVFDSDTSQFKKEITDSCSKPLAKAWKPDPDTSQVREKMLEELKDYSNLFLPRTLFTKVKDERLEKLKESCDMYNTYPCNILDKTKFDEFLYDGGYNYYAKKMFSKNLNTFLFADLQTDYPDKLDDLSPDMFFVQGPNGDIYVQSQISPVIDVYNSRDGRIMNRFFNDEDPDLACLFGNSRPTDKLQCKKNIQKRFRDMMAKPAGSLPKYDGLAVNDSGYVIRTTVFNKDEPAEHRTVEIFNPNGRLEAKDIPLDGNPILLLNTGPASRYFYFLKTETYYKQPVIFTEELSRSVKNLRERVKKLTDSDSNTVFLLQFLDFLDRTIQNSRQLLIKYSKEEPKRKYFSLKYLDNLSKYINKNNMRLSGLFMNLPQQIQSQITDLQTSLEKLTEIRRDAYEISQCELNN